MVMTLDIITGPRTLDEIQAALDACWVHNEHVPFNVRTEVGIAAGEVGANIIEHARATSFRMELRVHTDEMWVEFIYGGEPALVDMDQICMPDAMSERGRGLALAQAVLRRLSYVRDELGNHWKLVSKAFPARETYLSA